MSIFTFSVVSIALVTHRARVRWRRVAVSVPAVLLLAALMLVGLKMGFAQVLAAASHEDDLLSRIELPLAADGSRLDEAVNTTVYLRPEDVPAPVDRDSGGGDAGRRIMERGVLRVGYNGNPVPFAFFNGKGDLVGYDVEMAYDLARAMNVTRIEFVPVTPETLAGSLDSGYCDIVMSSVIVTPERLGEMKFTDPYVSVHMAFVVPDGRKEEFVRLEAVREMDGLRVAVFNGTPLADKAERLFPKATIVPIDSLEEFFVEKRADALFVAAEEGYPMTMSDPFYDVAVIEPGGSVPVMYAYPVARNSTESYLMALNYWLRTEKEYGELQRKVRLLGPRQHPGAGPAPLVRGPGRAALGGLKRPRLCPCGACPAVRACAGRESNPIVWNGPIRSRRIGRSRHERKVTRIDTGGDRVIGRTLLRSPTARGSSARGRRRPTPTRGPR